jgi:hypothetical protein
VNEYSKKLKVPLDVAGRRGLSELEYAFKNAVTGRHKAAGILGRHLAMVCEHSGEYRRAIAVLEQVLELLPQDGHTMCQVARTKRAAGDVEGAYEAYLSSAEFALKSGDYGLLSLIQLESEDAACTD